VDKLGLGSIVMAELSIGRHPAIVLSTEEEIASSGMVLVVAISANTTISRPEDMIEVPARLGMKKKCFVQCAVQEMLSRDQVTSKHRTAFGRFLEDVKKQAKIARDAAKKPTSDDNT
jgi:mRNA-degrading endonuclease toxin of MazEF toxin-antitoxin module